MWRSFKNAWRLARAVRTLGRYDALRPLHFLEAMPPILRFGLDIASMRLPGTGADMSDERPGRRLAKALEDLGPSYIKLGQFLATRADIVGAEMAADLEVLRDHLPPFDLDTATAIIEEELEHPWPELFSELGEPVAAASIAQVHPARTSLEAGGLAGRPVAVKVLRPEVERRFANDLESFYWAAALVERHYAPARRLRPVEVVATLAQSVRLEMDFRIEAASLSQMAENTNADEGFRVPAVDWGRTGRRVMTMEWVEGVSLADKEGLAAAAVDPKALSKQVVQSFLTHAMRDGFFHADMHQGNLFVDGDGALVAVDFGIMGTLDVASRRYLAEILWGFVERDYTRVAELHFEAGYVPAHQSVTNFALALRAIGEPVFDRPASEVSMGRLLAQLFQVTEQFEMRTRPELLMLQKTMVVVEGVARDLDPQFNIWETAEPILKAWIAERWSPEARLQEAGAGARQMTRLLSHAPDLMARGEQTLRKLDSAFDGEGVRLSPEALAQLDAQQSHYGAAALWFIAGAGAASLAFLLFQ